MKNKSMLRVLALVVVLSMIFTTAAFATPGNKKVRDEKNYKIAVESLIEKEIMKGNGHGDYGLEGNVKRGDVIVMIVRAFNIQISNEELGENFLDIAKDEYFYGPVKAAKELGIAKGDGKYFKPNKPVTIQEAIWLIERAEQLVDDDLDIEEDDLDVLFDENELNKFAKRKDIALMLHYMMTGENDYEDDEDEGEVEDDEIDDIKFKIDEDEVLPFTSTDNNFKDSIEDILEDFNSDIEYVKFDYPKNGTLYYEYNANSNENDLVTENTKYYLDGSGNLLEKITFVPKSDFSGTVNVSYHAYDDDGKHYSGKIIITVVDDGHEDLALIKYTTNENTAKEFEDDLDSNMDEVKFVQPSDKKGTLYFDYNGDGDLLDTKDVKASESNFYDDSEFDNIVFVPAQDFSGVVDIQYTAKDGEDSYSGMIRITVKEVQEIKTLKLSVDEDEDLVIDFKDELDGLTERGKIFTQTVFDSIDYVTFELPDQGKLMIDLDGDSDSYKNVVAGTEYKLNKILNLKYVPVDDSNGDDELVTINFTAVDEDKADKEYNGVIEIKVID
ncbi:MAG: S-layer homology domain-containing protein [Sedimentibacter saalensis]|uniref:S-layer family protein n=1 Tax=Sedimentibacter saalensis TaxID=130788 RepID=A0A562J5P1_9FIRM|nr:S-layer homology domain-containing protein [Sedimentibacter saalensis]MEA5094686.1 S-layer homology domain-containing protein [Sedimentibacter saalensis]TWH78437.1 S-layer family protein [Sedimentibacter saalensis]